MFFGIKHIQNQCPSNSFKFFCCILLNKVFSVADENTHAVAGALIYKTLLEEAKLTEEEIIYLTTSMQEIAKEVFKPKKIGYFLVGTCIGAHSGPGVGGILVFKK